MEEEVLPGGELRLEEQGGLGQSCFEITPQALGPDMSRTLPSSQRGLEKLLVSILTLGSSYMKAYVEGPDGHSRQILLWSYCTHAQWG